MIRSSIGKLSLLMLFTGCTDVNKDKRVILPIDSPAEKIKLVDLENNTVDLAKYAGKTIFVNFWATWCKPCIEEMPSIEKAQNILRDEGVLFLLASNERSEEIESFRSSHDYNFNYMRVINSEDLGIEVLPTTFIFNSRGKLVLSEPGSRNWSEKGNIDMLLKIARNNE